MPARYTSGALLLHLTPAKQRIATVASRFRASVSARTMASKPSLKAAEDFLSFVNASPTRRLLAP